jgi:hypothetical protein
METEMKMLNNVLVKMTSGGRCDLVLYVDNVPFDMFYEMKHPRKCVGQGQQQHWEADTDKPMVPTLHEELRLSQTGDKGIVFDLDNEPSRARFTRLNRYIKQMFPPNQILPEAIPYAVDPTDPSSPALALSQVPRVALPSLSPRGDEPLRESSAASALDLEAVKKQAVADYLEQQNKDRMARVRAAKSETVSADEASK